MSLFSVWLEAPKFEHLHPHTGPCLVCDSGPPAPFCCNSLASPTWLLFWARFLKGTGKHAVKMTNSAFWTSFYCATLPGSLCLSLQPCLRRGTPLSPPSTCIQGMSLLLQGELCSGRDDQLTLLQLVQKHGEPSRLVCCLWQWPGPVALEKGKHHHHHHLCEAAIDRKKTILQF